jgi:hypothetical protein
MRSSPIFFAVLLCACIEAPGKGERRPEDRTTRPAASSDTPAAVQSGSVPAFTSVHGSADDGADGVAELQRLIDTRRMIAMDRLDVDSVSAAEFAPNVASTPSVYGGEYHFGDSEWESELTLTVEGNTVTGELGYADWENETWVGKEVRFEGGTITGASFSAPGWKGVFVLYEGEPGVIILRAPTDRIGIQYGNKH